MKKQHVILTSLILTMALTGSGYAYEPGTYTGTAMGMGEVTATVTVDEENILDVVLDVSNETENIGAAQGDVLRDQVLEAQGGEIEGVTGATATSTAVADAVKAALALASGEAEDAQETGSALLGTEADVIVVGAGGAGLAAAIRAADLGASVIVLESQPTAGGTAKISAVHYSVINPEWDAVEGQRNEELEERLNTFLTYDPADFGEYADALLTLQEQVKEYLESDSTADFDSVERMLIEHYQNVILTPGPDNDGVWAHAYLDLTLPAYENTMAVYQFLLDSGVTFESDFDIRSLTPTGEGVGFTNTMVATAADRGIRIDYNTTAISLIEEDGKIVGVRAEDADGNETEYKAHGGVVLCTGGFGSNAEMAASYDNRYAINEKTPSSEAPGATGLGITMAQEVGADTVDMQFIQVFPFPAYDDYQLVASIMTMGNAKMAVGADGKRIADDSKLGPYDDVSVAARTLEGEFFYLVGDAETIEGIQNGMGYPENSIFIGNTLEEVATAAGVDPEGLAASVEAFNGYVEAGEDPEFGREEFAGKIETSPYCIVVYADKIQQTMGGLKIDPKAHVLDTEGNIIPGLYAAGEVTGGLEGADRVHGDNYAEIFYYGMTAGEMAAAGE